MIDKLSEDFLKNPILDNAINLLRYTRLNNIFNVGSVLGDYFIGMFPYSIAH